MAGNMDHILEQALYIVAIVEVVQKAEAMKRGEV